MLQTLPQILSYPHQGDKNIMESESNKSLVLSINDLVGDNQSSVELKQTSRGVNVGVKCYATNVESAKEQAVKAFDELLQKYQRDPEQ